MFKIKMNEEPEAIEEAPEEETIDLAELLGGKNGVWGPREIVHFGSETRTILVAGEVDETMSAAIVSQLLELETESTEPITVLVNTPGGDVTQGLAIYDTMRILHSPIITIAMGECMSMGLPIILGGDVRLAYPSTIFFHHQMIGGTMYDSKHKLDSYVDFHNMLTGKVNAIFRERTKINKKDWEKHWAPSTSKFFTAEEALKHGFIHKILEYPKKKLKLKDLA